MSAKSEIHAFTMAPELLYSVISSQSGTPAKAILEGVMNCIDAGATQAIIDVNDKGFTISDDGRGFESKQTIVDFFGTFGKKHEEGDAVFGTYRMGRGQLMSFGRNTWHSGDFKMAVDIKNKGLDYELTELAEKDKVNGCHIQVNWYDKMLPSEIDAVHREFKEMAAFAQIPIIYNGVQCNTLPSEIKWDIETDDAYFKFKASGGLSVYNLGVLVRTYGGHTFGCGGIIVSKKQLKVNFARNEILLNKCEVWKEVSKKIKSETAVRVDSKKTRITEDERIAIGRMLLAGEIEAGTTVSNSKLITNIKNGHASIETLLNKIRVGMKVTFTEPGERQGDLLHSREMAYVISDVTLNRFDARTPEMFFDALFKILDLRAAGYEVSYNQGSMSAHIKRALIDHHNQEVVRLKEMIKSCYIEFDKIKDDVLGSHSIIDEKELNKNDKLALSAIHTLANALPYSKFFRELGVTPRRIKVGISEVSEAWTDGSSYIAINKNLLTEFRTKGFAGIARITGILVHEYIHTSSDSGSHTHDLEFMEAFHEAMLFDGYHNPMSCAASCLSNYAKSYRKNGEAPPTSITKAVDDMVTADISESEAAPEGDPLDFEGKAEAA